MTKKIDLEALEQQLALFAETEYQELLKSKPHGLQKADGGDEKSAASLGISALPPSASVHVLANFRPTPAELPLNAYLASALTGLSDEQMGLVERLSDQIDEVCKSLDIELYEPRKHTDPVKHADVADTEVYDLDKEKVVSSDLIIHLAHFPSTGSGEELDFAHNAMVPIVLVHLSTTRISRMVTGIPGLIVKVGYDSEEDLKPALYQQLLELRPQLVQRKLAFGDYDSNIVGNRIRMLREAQGLTRADLSAASEGRFPISVEMLRQLEESQDRHANPSLIHLREIATLLKTSVAELVEPDLGALFLSEISHWIIGEGTAARFANLSDRDAKSLIRRVMFRLMDHLEE